MFKKKYIILGVIFIYAVLTLTTTDLKVIVVDSIIKEQSGYHATKWLDTYFYYTSDEGIYKVDKSNEPQLILKIDGVIAMTCNDTHLFIAKRDGLIKVRYNGVKVAKTEDKINDSIGLYVNGKKLLITNNSFIKEVDINSLDLKCSEYSINQEAYMEKENIYGNRILYWLCDDFLYRNLNNRYYVEPTYPIEITRSKEGERRKKLLELPRGVYVKENNIAINNDRIIVVGQNDSSSIDIGDIQYLVYELLTAQLIKPRQGHPYPVDKKLVLHKSDYLGIYDLDNGKALAEHYTKKGERIIFSDLEKTITYYKGKLITYDSFSWNVENKQKIKGIKNKSTYSFELCGKKLFIYDEYYKLLYIKDI